jgi:hypothetical protein
MGMLYNEDGRRPDGSSRRKPMPQPQGSYDDVRKMFIGLLKPAKRPNGNAQETPRERERKLPGRDQLAVSVGRFHGTEHAAQLKRDLDILDALAEQVGGLIENKRAQEASHALMVFLGIDNPKIKFTQHEGRLEYLPPELLSDKVRELIRDNRAEEASRVLLISLGLGKPWVATIEYEGSASGALRS